MAISVKGAHFPQDIMLMGVRWYLASPLSYRHVEELMAEYGVRLDHATIQRWVVKYSPCWKRFASSQAAGVRQLALGRDIYSCQRPVAVSVSCGRHIRPDH
jgi:transposase-like protein